MRTSPLVIARAALVAAVFLSRSLAAQATSPTSGSTKLSAADSAAIMTSVASETAAFWNKDFNAWADYWVHAPYVRVEGWWARGGVTVREGWDTISGEVKRLMQGSPQPNPTATRLRRENINLQVRGSVAWLTFDEYGLSTGDSTMDMPGLSRETRVLEKQNGKWRIAYSGWLLQGAPKDSTRK